MLSKLSHMDFQIKFESFNIKFKNESKEKIHIKQNLYFSNCYFKQMDLKNICFKDFAISNYKPIDDYKAMIEFNNCEFKNLHFNYNNFLESVKFTNNTKICNLHLSFNTFEKYFYVKNCFIKEVDWYENTFNDKCYFYSIFFKNNAYFINSHFKDSVDFYKCEFEKTASFYGARFDKTPNFSQVIFKGNLNVVNTNLNFTFDDLQDRIKQEYEDFNKDKNEKNKKSLDKFANDFRDSFRNFKSALIKDNNLLEASSFHKYELYCKEIELEEKKPKIFSKEWIDKWQLIFYRKLCDHHTDLLKVFHNLLIIIMLFSVFSFVFDKFKQPSIENNAKYHIVQVDTNESYIFKEHNKTTYNIFGLNINKESGKLDEFIKNNFVYILILLFIVLPILSFNIFTNLYIFGSFFYVIFNFLDLVALYTHIAIISLFVFFALKFILFDDKQEIIRKIIIGVSYIVCIFALLVKPSLMLPVFGSFLEKDSNATYPLLFSLSVVYFILVALVLFSLQKTARKNSIMPS
ncbi:pentapeptide repeat-containing protein [Campylobacter peloridis]|uniref:Pentapeptide repeat-containing protein n=2 Tax=Campylobacter peloridis TaxID=488546 RepID=A0ABX6TX50_9BACT|nr:pentapeptide repeat-containing protein [Campylobacter peloridis]